MSVDPVKGTYDSLETRLFLNLQFALWNKPNMWFAYHRELHKNLTIQPYIETHIYRPYRPYPRPYSGTMVHTH